MNHAVMDTNNAHIAAVNNLNLPERNSEAKSI